MRECIIHGDRISGWDALYDQLSEELALPEWFGRNLDALYDIVTGLPHLGRLFRIVLPSPDAPCRGYAEILAQVLDDAGAQTEVEG